MFDELPHFVEIAEQVLVETLVARLPLKLSIKPFCIGLSVDVAPFDVVLEMPSQDVFEVNSVPLSLRSCEAGPWFRRCDRVRARPAGR